MKNEIASNKSSSKSLLLMLANSILQSLQQEIQIDDEDYLFNDEFYITIVSSIVPENTCNIQVGETEEEKSESLQQLIQFLSSIVEMNLDHINGRAIIEERDEESVRHLLELILELIIVLREEQNDNVEVGEVSRSEEMMNIQDHINKNNIEGESYDNANNEFNVNGSSNLEHLENEDSNNMPLQDIEGFNAFSLGGNPNKMQTEARESQNEINFADDSYNNYNLRENKSLPAVEFEPENTSQINFKEYYSQNDLTRYEKVMAYLANNEEFLNEQEQYQVSIDIDKTPNANNNAADSNHMNIFANSQMDDDLSKPAVNISRISEVSRSKENYSEPHSQQKYMPGNNNKHNFKGESDNITIKMTNSNIRMTSQGDSYGGPSKISSVESKLRKEDVLLTNERNDEEEEYIFNNTESRDLDVNESNKSVTDNAKKNDVKKNNYVNKDKNSNRISAPSNKLSTGGKNASVSQKGRKESSRSNLTNKSGSQKDKSLKSLKGSSKKNVKASSRNQSKSERSGKENSNNNLEKFESSLNEGKLDERERGLKKIKSQKQLIDKRNNKSYSSKNDLSKSSVQNSQDNSRRNFHMNIHNNNQSNHSNSNYMYNQDHEDLSENLIEELPLDRENLKFEIMKEFRRLYGDKLDKVILKNNLNNSSNMFEVILRNIRLARQKMIKIGVGNSDPDDIITKEFMLKYSKELEYIINYYHNEDKKRNFFRMKAVNSMSKNYSLMHRLQEIENKNIENEIDRRRKSREIRSKHNQIKMCNEIYSKALELEKQKYLEERANQAEIRRAENQEKRNVMVQIENYYKDKINILKEILRREKYEKEIEHRAKIQFLSKFEREKKANFKKQIDGIFDRLDEEDRKYDFLNSNSEQLEKVLMNYYKK